MRTLPIEILVTLSSVASGLMAAFLLGEADRPFVEGHQARLSHGREHLFGRDFLWELRKFEPFSSRCHGSRRDHYHLTAFIVEVRHLAYDLDNMGWREMWGARRESRGSQFDNDTFIL